MAFWSGGRKKSVDVSAVTVGMRKEEVASLLGRADKKYSLADQYENIGPDHPLAQKNFWMYFKTPRGHDTMITFQIDEVIEIESRPR